MLDGKIIKGVGGLYEVSTSDGAYKCVARGILRRRGVTPTIGDDVTVRPSGDGLKEGAITAIKPRRSFLERPRVANIDAALIVFAIKNPKFNASLLDRFLISAAFYNVPAIICFNKLDLLKEREKPAFDAMTDIYKNAGYRVELVSAETGAGLAELGAAFAGETTVCSGPSGVGKSSIINALVSRYAMETGGLSEKIQRGKHTTRHAELLALDNGGFIVDTPGFAAIDISDAAKKNMSAFFPEFSPYAGLCRFNDCKHLNEPDCAVKRRVGADISPERYDRYVEFMTR
ncbi:MAG: ribosome small subunit-dependent GTPase A [Clostridiales bacterium]|jgi:ribosome biogenesis GTPase|nr:ribosome small subunit-dependent GTPase A [Clostridiales bacterium]